MAGGRIRYDKKTTLARKCTVKGLSSIKSRQSISACQQMSFYFETDWR